MRLYTVKKDGKALPAVSFKGKMYLLGSLGVMADDMNEVIENFTENEKIIGSALEGELPEEICDYEVLAPITAPRQDLLCLGVNYHEHMTETKDIIDFSDKEAAIYFGKRVNRFSATGEEIPYYDFVDSLDYEVELGVILKKDALNVSVEAAKDHILGYTIINDVSARNLQLRHKQWYRGKSLDGYTPMGPCIVTSDEISDPHDLEITCRVNGKLRQSSNTHYMITSVEEAISEFSQGITLKAGTVIATGTPGGVGMGMKPPAFLKPGDRVTCQIEMIGTLENKVASL